eukprot:scaffold188775_cov22-Tisochrysis_lutea.AAC.1
MLGATQVRTERKLLECVESNAWCNTGTKHWVQYTQGAFAKCAPVLRATLRLAPNAKRCTGAH